MNMRSAAMPAAAKAGEILDAKAAAMAVKLPINLTGKTTFATRPPRRIAEVLTGGPALLARKDAH